MWEIFYKISHYEHISVLWWTESQTKKINYVMRQFIFEDFGSKIKKKNTTLQMLECTAFLFSQHWAFFASFEQE